MKSFKESLKVNHRTEWKSPEALCAINKMFEINLFSLSLSSVPHSIRDCQQIKKQNDKYCIKLKITIFISF